MTRRKRSVHLRLAGPHETAPGVEERARALAGIRAIEQRIGTSRALMLVATDPVAVAALMNEDPQALLGRLRGITGTRDA